MGSGAVRVTDRCLFDCRSAGEVESDVPAVRGEELPHLLSDNDGTQIRADRYDEDIPSLTMC